MTILSALLSLTLWQDIGYAEAKERALAFREVAARAFTDGYVGYVPSSTIYDSVLEEDRIPRAYRIRFPDGVVRVETATGRIRMMSMRPIPYPKAGWDDRLALSVQDCLAKLTSYYHAAGFTGNLIPILTQAYDDPGNHVNWQILALQEHNGVAFHFDHYVHAMIRYDSGRLEDIDIWGTPDPPAILKPAITGEEASQVLMNCLREKITYLPVKELYAMRLGIWRPRDSASNLVKMEQRYVDMGKANEGLLVWWARYVDPNYPGPTQFSGAFHGCVDAKTGELIFAEVPSVFGGTRIGQSTSMLRWDLGSGPITMYVPGKKPITIRQADVTAVPTPKGQSSAGRRLELQRGRLFIQVRYNRQTGLLRMEGSGAYGSPNRTLKIALDKLCLER